MNPPKRFIIVTGQPRNAAITLPRLARQAPEDTTILGFCWESSGAETVGGVRYFDQLDVIEMAKVCSSGFASKKQPPSPSDEQIRWARKAQSIVKELSLKPNPAATVGWLSALGEAGTIAAKLPDDALVLVTRPDIYWPDGALAELFNFVSYSPDVIHTAIRPISHRVIRFKGEKHELPVDHWFIGRASEIGKLATLANWLESMSNDPGEVPFVNEFLLGHFFHRHSLAYKGVLAPYLLFREFAATKSGQPLSHWDEFRIRHWRRNGIKIDRTSFIWKMRFR